MLLDPLVVQFTYGLRAHRVHSTEKETEVRPSPCPPRTLSHTGVGVGEVVAETHGKVEKNKGGVRMHMLEDKRKKGPYLIRDFINKVRFKMGLESSRRILKALSDSSRQRNHLQFSSLLEHHFVGELVPKGGKKGMKTERSEGKVWKTLSNVINMQPKSTCGEQMEREFET